jgi:hypothetical protein
MAETGKPGTNWKQVKGDARRRVAPLVNHYAKMAHPFTQCVADNTKRFGPDGAKRVCAVVKDMGRRSTKWRNQEEALDALLEAADWEVEALEEYLLTAIVEAEAEAADAHPDPAVYARRRARRRRRREAVLGRGTAGTKGDVDAPDAGPEPPEPEIEEGEMTDPFWLEEDFDPRQPRDDEGKWTSGMGRKLSGLRRAGHLGGGKKEVRPEDYNPFADPKYQRGMKKSIYSEQLARMGKSPREAADAIQRMDRENRGRVGAAAAAVRLAAKKPESKPLASMNEVELHAALSRTSGLARIRIVNELRRRGQVVK